MQKTPHAYFVALLGLFAFYFLMTVSMQAEEKEPAKEPAKEAAKRTLHTSEDFAAKFWYAGDQSIEEYVKGNACIAGIWWKCTKEEANYYVGDLHYPTSNQKGAPRYYMAAGLKIKKSPDMPIDLKTFSGELVLLDPTPETHLESVNDKTEYELIGFHKGDQENRHIFHEKLFSPDAEK